MSDYPECPICEHRMTEAVPQSIEGSIKLRCPSCGQLYEYIPNVGSFPLDQDYGITVSKGVLSSRMQVGASESVDEVSLSHALLIGGLCCCTIAVLIPVILAFLLAILG